jgi:hypothetical protein
MAQYAISEINDKRFLIDASEFGWIKEHGSEDNTWADIESRPQSKRMQRLVYGCFLKNPSQVTGPLDPKSFHERHGDGVCSFRTPTTELFLRMALSEVT